MTEVREWTEPQRRSTTLALVVRVVVALLFIYIGAQKLFPGGGLWIRLFEQIGLGQWFRFFTAGVEMAAGVLMLFPGWSTAGAVLAMASMVGAIVVHATVTGFGPQTVAVSILMALSARVGWSGRHRMRIPITVTRRRVIIGGAIGFVAMYMACNAVPTGPFDVTGQWSGRTLTGVPIQLELKAEGPNLTGALTRNRRSSPITRGRITPEGLAFTARLGRQMEDFSGSYRAGQRIYLTLDSAGVTAPLTAVTFRRDSPQP